MCSQSLYHHPFPVAAMTLSIVGSLLEAELTYYTLFFQGAFMTNKYKTEITGLTE